ncbi:MAG: CPBP family intramembrane glutamic endopeptidase [Cyanobacteria bacterium P01_A01_bin.37]
MLAEEIFFRAYIQQNLQKKTNAILAVIFAALLFAAIHSPYTNLILKSSNQDWHLSYITIFGGLISGILYFKSESIGPSIVFHVFWNTMAQIA